MSLRLRIHHLDMTIRLQFALCVSLLAACGGPVPGADRRSGMTQRERDSTIGASLLPGAGGVRRALAGSDSATARNARLDSAAAQP
ncbi:MAG: hypothetical protein NVS4B3_13250 [Gemmatimonadaceae bacterium]